MANFVSNACQDGMHDACDLGTNCHCVCHGDQIVFEYYEVLGNSDQTEGKGAMVARRRYVEEDDAVRWADSKEGHRECGVMGHGPGTVQRVVYYRPPNGQILRSVSKVWGYRKAPWKQAWDYGYLDFRDEPSQDPDYQTYMRLKNRFEGE